MFEDLKDDLSRCARCGRCRSVCPVFLEVQRETAVARGKIALLEGMTTTDITAPSKRLVRILSQCLLCGACSVHCTNSVRLEEWLEKARFEIMRRGGLPIHKRLAFRQLLGRPKTLDTVVRVLSSLEQALFKGIPEGCGLRLRFPLPGIDPSRFLPAIHRPFFLQRIARRDRSVSKEGSPVGLFIGCSIHYLFPGMGKAGIRLLEDLGLSPWIPVEQGCCGLVSFGSGDWEAARGMAQRNIEAFGPSGCEEIVVLCSSCYAHLKKGVPRLFEDAPPVVREKALRFSERVREVSEFLFERGWEPGSGGSGANPHHRTLRVTYHDPCHLKRRMGISDPPRAILKGLPGVEFVEMADADRCCGMGGLFGLEHYGLSRRILQHKLRALQETGAECLVTNCMGCILQFQDGLKDHPEGVRVKHLVEVLCP